MKADIFEQCQKLFPEWADCSMADFAFDDPKGFSSFTMGIRAKKAVQPTAVLYRRLEGKENDPLRAAAICQIFTAVQATLGHMNLDI